MNHRPNSRLSIHDDIPQPLHVGHLPPGIFDSVDVVFVIGKSVGFDLHDRDEPQSAGKQS